MSDEAGPASYDPVGQDEPGGLRLAARSHAELVGSPPSRLGWPGRLAKRALRRLLRFQVLPQWHFNAGTLQALEETTARLASVSARLEGLEAHLPRLTADLQRELADLRNGISGLEGHLSRFTADVERDFAADRERRDGLQREVAPIGERLDALAARFVGLESHVTRFVGDVQNDFATARSSLLAQGRQLDEVSGELVAASADVEAVQEEWQEAQQGQRALEQRVRTLEKRFEPLRNLDHFDFARRYRGDPKLIEQRLREYARQFGQVQRVLDFGCGRGEFLQICSELGIGAYGVDSDPDMVGHCRLKRLDAIHADALEHLRNLPDRHLDGLFSAQVVEHLTPAQLAETIELASRKLKRGARLIIETINPNTFSALRWFFLDPTHCQPVPAEMLRFFLEQADFQILDILYTSEVAEDERLVFLKEGTQLDDPAVADLLRIINENSRRLNQAIFGPQDYAIIAER